MRRMVRFRSTLPVAFWQTPVYSAIYSLIKTAVEGVNVLLLSFIVDSSVR